MCGRYVLALRPSQVRAQLERNGMPVEESPGEEDTRQTYNVAPGYYELVYRADVSDKGAGPIASDGQDDNEHPASAPTNTQETKYKLQAMKWGLVPFWTKRNPDYGSMMKTINCRDDSLIENRGMWNTMKQRKRCIVVVQGFYEWLKKNGGKEKIPHYIKRQDGQLMCLAGLWDCVRFEGSEEKLYTYSIITTSSNEAIKFLHDRMPVILENGSDQLRTWLDPERHTWSKELQSLLKPFDGKLDIYPVSKDVSKVGNNSPNFVVPLASAENKNNIANFFANSKNGKGGKENAPVKAEEKAKGEKAAIDSEEIKQSSTTIKQETSEDNAPLPAKIEDEESKGIKRERDENDKELAEPEQKSQKVDSTPPAKPPAKTRSATSNQHPARSSPGKSPVKGDEKTPKITNFFNK